MEEEGNDKEENNKQQTMNNEQQTTNNKQQTMTMPTWSWYLTTSHLCVVVLLSYVGIR